MALTLMAFRPRRAVTQTEGEWGGGVQVVWSSIEEVNRYNDDNPTQSVAFDGETIRTTFRGRYGVSDSVDVEVELPFLWAGSGGADHLIKEYHSLFGLPDGARDNTPDDDYEMSVTSDGYTLYELEGNTLRAQDIPLFLTWQLLEEAEGVPAIATRLGVEFPTGSEERGLGNGAFDFGAGVIVEKSLDRWTVTGGFDWVFPGDSERLEEAPDGDFHYDPMLSLKLAGEYRWNDFLSLIAGTIWTSRMLHSVSYEEVNREVFDLGWGVAWDTGGSSRLAISLHEDLVSATGSDLSLQLGWAWGY